MTIIEHYAPPSYVLPKAEMAAYDPYADYQAESDSSMRGLPLCAATYGLLGNATGAAAGMALATAMDWSIWQGAALAVIFGAILGTAYAATSLSRMGMPFRRAVSVALLLALPANFWLLWKARVHAVIQARGVYH